MRNAFQKHTRRNGETERLGSTARRNAAHERSNRPRARIATPSGATRVRGRFDRLVGLRCRPTPSNRSAFLSRFADRPDFASSCFRAFVVAFAIVIAA
ncbi:MAG: hypothetical protein AUH43_27180 [Acidobacteria bacterium 13_1_40CM_65_14]|nr:MAG: hypothetical protein AUH43_27180 [Acidobacteria bacterium 13_1_40CM_65_14]OLC83513.1 MAG: hypothetical protein AUH72_04150 [Acidobacteria bacterium 13_1_40CM_4_65_8]